MSDQPLVLVDDPAPQVRRLTLNRPEKRNALSNRLRSELFEALHAGDRDADVHVMIIRGAGTCFSAGYDLRPDPADPQPWFTTGGDGQWPRHVVAGWFDIWARPQGSRFAGRGEFDAAVELTADGEQTHIGRNGRYPICHLFLHS